MSEEINYRNRIIDAILTYLNIHDETILKHVFEEYNEQYNPNWDDLQKEITSVRTQLIKMKT